MSLRIRDAGGGISPIDLTHIFSYAFTSVSKDVDTDELDQDNAGPYAAQSGSGGGGGRAAYSTLGQSDMQTPFGSIAGQGYGYGPLPIFLGFFPFLDAFIASQATIIKVICSILWWRARNRFLVPLWHRCASLSLPIVDRRSSLSLLMGPLRCFCYVGQYAQSQLTTCGGVNGRKRGMNASKRAKDNKRRDYKCEQHQRKNIFKKKRRDAEEKRTFGWHAKNKNTHGLPS